MKSFPFLCIIFYKMTKYDKKMPKRELLLKMY